MKRLGISVLIIGLSLTSISLGKTASKSNTKAASKPVSATTSAATAKAPVPKPPEVIKPIIPGIMDAFQSPFLYVYGTQSKDSNENRVVKRTVEDVVNFWKVGRNRTEQYKADTEVTLSDISSYHLLLYGSPASNKIIAQIYQQLPLLIESNSVIGGTKKFTGDSIGLIMIAPNPLNPKKYAVIYWGSDYKSRRWINSVPYGKTDYVIFYDQSFLLPKKEQPEPPIIEKGFFDKTDPMHWKYVPPPPPPPTQIPSLPVPEPKGTNPPIRTETSFEL
ncbi:MAG: hypothetical protein ACE14V_06015 [bacterium]